MFKIGEFSKLTKVSKRMLRYYDEIGILKPANIDNENGYRLYTIEQIPSLQRIVLLRDMKFSVSEIAIAINNWTDDFLIEQLTNKTAAIKDLIQAEQERLRKIEIAIEDIRKQTVDVHYNFVLKTIPCYSVISLRRIIPNYFFEGDLWNELVDFARGEHIDILQNMESLTVYHDTEYKDNDVDVEVCLVVNKLGENENGFTYRTIDKVDTMACAMVYGTYNNIDSAFRSFADWLQQHSQYKMVGNSRQICHKGKWNEEDPNKYLTEIQIPVIKQILNISENS